MIIPINVLPTASRFDDNKLPPQLARIGTDEVVLIEFQGSFQTEGDRAGQLVGHLHMGDTDSVKPILRVGYHHLEGKIVNLPKPLAVLAKNTGGKSTTSKDEQMLVDSEDPQPSSNTQASSTPEMSYDIVAIIKRKILFSKRPMPVVRPAPGESSKAPAGS